MALKGRWRREGGSEWWMYEGDPCPLAGVEFKSTRWRDKQLEGVYSRYSEITDEGFLKVLVLVEILELATHVRVSDYFSGCLDNLYRIKDAPSISANHLQHLEFQSRPRPQMTREEKQWANLTGEVSTVLPAQNFRMRCILDGAWNEIVFRLESLVWNGLCANNQDIQNLADAIKKGHFPCLSSLSLAENEFGSQGVHYLADSLRFLGKNLRHLCLSRNSIARRPTKEGSGHLALAQAIESGCSPFLETLSLQCTDMSPLDCEAYEKALSSGNLQALKEIDFSLNLVGEKGAKALGRAFGSGMVKTLVVIRLNQNYFGEEGLNELFAGLEVGCKELEELHLNSASLQNNGLLTVARALSSGNLDCLKILELSKNKLNISNEKGARALVSALATNIRLTVEMQFDWYLFPDLDLMRGQLLERNVTHREILAELVGTVVPATIGKVYVCGNPEVGKTTLSKSLQRSVWKSLIRREKSHSVEEPTRGINVSQISSKGGAGKHEVSLALWDMAGQRDFHMLHNAFLPDLTPNGGKANTFVVVCTSHDKENARQELHYWLRFIASSCSSTIQTPRNVFVVFSRMNGDSEILKNAKEWKDMLDSHRTKFKGSLQIRFNPFIVDVRRRNSAKDIKRCLLEHCRAMLQNETIPSVCQFISKNVSVWSEERKQFPVLPWMEVLQKIEGMDLRCYRLSRTLEAAAKYLTEVGVVVYIDKECPAEWEVQSRKLLVLDPNWFCGTIMGKILVPREMAVAGENLFREQVDQSSGSISMTQFSLFFRSLLGELDNSQLEDLVVILLLSGLCYKGRDENLFFPALTDDNKINVDCWGPNNVLEHGEGQWVMGYSVRHTRSEVALAPIALWHRFQVEVAQTHKFNGQAPDNDFITGKCFIAFKVDYMGVLIEVDANQDHPTFDGIHVLVKPLLTKDMLDSNSRKQCQVDLASDLVETFRKLWNHVCPSIAYVLRVVWPWPACGSMPNNLGNRNVEVGEVKKWIAQHGMGKSMQWQVGSDTISEDQLLSRRDKEYVVQSVEGSIHVGMEILREAVELRIFPNELLREGGTAEGSTCKPLEGECGEASTSACEDIEPSSLQPLTQSDQFVFSVVQGIHKKLDNLRGLGEKTLMVAEKNLEVSQQVSADLRQVMRIQKTLLEKVHDLGRIILEDEEQSCPRFIYLGTKNSSAWITLKAAMSISVKVHVHFLCEAKFSDYGQHAVKGQQGIDISQMKDWFQKVAPWLKVALAVLFISFKVAANVVAPGVSAILPDSQTWKQALSLTAAIASATGFTPDELDKLAGNENNGQWAKKMKNVQGSRELYGNTRIAMTELLGRLTAEDFEKKLGLRKVCLRHNDGSMHGVVWICTECVEKYRASSVSVKLVTELQ